VAERADGDAGDGIEVATAASVRPWKLACAVRIRGRSMPRTAWPCLRASLIAASLASAPELQKNTRSAQLRAVIASARRSCSGIR